jgi:hypothetical protein
MKKLEHHNLVKYDVPYHCECPRPHRLQICGRACVPRRLHEVIDDVDELFLVLDYVDGGTVLDWDADTQLYSAKLGNRVLPDGRRLYTEALAAVRLPV